MKILDAIRDRNLNTLIRVQYVKKIFVEQQETLLTRANRMKALSDEAATAPDVKQKELQAEHARIATLSDEAYQDEQLAIIKARCDGECDFDVNAQESAKALIGREV